jgi:hypothetical protein
LVVRRPSFDGACTFVLESSVDVPGNYPGARRRFDDLVVE